MRILIIEDDERLLELYQTFQEMLESKSTVIEIAKTGAQAMDSLNQSLPDVVLIDLFMPDINGMDILKYLAESHQISKTKAYILTNLTDDKIEKEALEMGAAGYVIKSNISFQVMKNLLETGSLP